MKMPKFFKHEGKRIYLTTKPERDWRDEYSALGRDKQGAEYLLAWAPEDDGTVNWKEYSIFRNPLT